MYLTASHPTLMTLEAFSHLGDAPVELDANTLDCPMTLRSLGEPSDTALPSAIPTRHMFKIGHLESPPATLDGGIDEAIVISGFLLNLQSLGKICGAPSLANPV